MASKPDLFRCTVCHSTFSRHENLRRHQVCHTTERQQKCNFCESTFKRRDVLRKHMKTCSVRINQGFKMPSIGCPGKKVRACDQCAGTKKACDSGRPCSRCVVKRRECTYERLPFREDLGQDSSDLGFEIVGGAEDTPFESADHFATLEFSEWASSRHLFPGPNGSPNTLASWDLIPHFNYEDHVNYEVPTREPLRFLLNVVKDGGLNSVFNFDRSWRYGESHGDDGCAGGDTLHQESHSIADTWISPTSGTKWQPQGSRSLPLNQCSDDFGFTHMAQWLADPLFSQSKGIWELLRATRSRNSRSPPEESSAEDGQLLEFFGPAKLRTFLDLFWAGWYPHCPIVHKPTFDVLKAPCALVASMAMIGACMSLGEDRARAHNLLDTLEAAVFEHALFQDEFLDVENYELLLQILQAGHFVCVLQNWEGNDKGKKRARQQRFTSLVAAARLIGLSRARHSWNKYLAYAGSFNWQEFYTTESIIRTFTYIFLVDSAFVIFNKSPPRMIIEEMDIDLPNSDSAFQALTPEACFAILNCSKQYEAQPSSKLLLREAVQNLTQPSFTLETWRLYAQMDTLSLFTILSAFHSIVFQISSTIRCIPVALSPLRTALDRWKSIWDSRRYEPSLDPAMEAWQGQGFSKNAHEFWHLAIASLDAVQGSSKKTSGISTGGRSDTTKSLCLDDSSMRLVMDLMLGVNLND